MKNITLVRRGLNNVIPGQAYALELEVTAAQDMPLALFVKQRIPNNEGGFDDVFAGTASSEQLESLPENSPDSNSSFFRTSKVVIYATNPDFLEDIYKLVLSEFQNLSDNQAALTTLATQSTVTIAPSI